MGRALTFVLAAGLGPSFGAAATLPGQGVDYNDHVRPILSDRCYTCHGPDPGQRQAGLRLDREADALSTAASGAAAIVPGRPGESGLLERVSSADPARRMPPAYLGHDPLSEAEIETLRRWIEQGAPWEGHWAFSPPTRPELPRGAGEAPGPIDALVRAALSCHDEADFLTRLRRG